MWLPSMSRGTRAGPLSSVKHGKDRLLYYGFIKLFFTFKRFSGILGLVYDFFFFLSKGCLISSFCEMNRVAVGNDGYSLMFLPPIKSLF